MEALTSNTWVVQAVSVAVIIVVALLIQLVAVRAMRRGFEAARIAHASIFVNMVRALIWFVALLLIVEAIFGVEPTAFIAALGVTSIVISFGLQDTVSNLFGGIILMTSRVIGIGDVIKVGNALGTVKDITWRSTAVELRDGNTEIIPNSVLSKASLTRYTEKSACAATVNFSVCQRADASAVEQEIIACVERVLGEHLRSDYPMQVRFGDLDAYGINAKVTAFVKDTMSLTDAQDMISREISKMPWLANALHSEGQ
ncbi:MAG: mechanosensitive ion channel [Atopobiaceae bacterium]|nr:mechanosensitive ion channel [Atopobiaceae bacterium]